MTDEQRRAFENLILLCPNHHKTIDVLEPEQYPPASLAEWKVQHDQRFGSLPKSWASDFDLECFARSLSNDPPLDQSSITTEVAGPSPLERYTTYDRVRAEVAAGHQGYVICPLVERSLNLEVKAATEEFDRLTRDELRGLRVGLLHGRMSAAKKRAVIQEFGAGELDVLVTTTAVVDVGDVPNATVMVIEDAHRFGFVQLQQLRGMLANGRADRSWCYLVAEPTTRTAVERLIAMRDAGESEQLSDEGS